MQAKPQPVVPIICKLGDKPAACSLGVYGGGHALTGVAQVGPNQVVVARCLSRVNVSQRLPAPCDRVFTFPPP